MRTRAVLLLLLAAAPARAVDPPAPAPDSLASAKRDFATIKSLSGPSDSSPALPALEMKDLTPGPAGGHADVPALVPDEQVSLDPAKAKEKEGTGNWLVDAMEKRSDRPGSASDAGYGTGKGEKDFLRDAGRSSPHGELQAAPSDLRESADDKEPAGAVYNPLDSFMSGWISARDHDLLLPAAKGDGLSAAELGKSQVDMLPNVAGDESGFEPASMDGGGPSGVKSGPNPYIEALDLGPIAPVRFFSGPEASGLSPSESKEPPISMGVDERPLDEGRTFIPDFAQPSDDDKYFKQLKRF